LATATDDWGLAAIAVSLFVTGPVIGGLLVIGPAAILARHVSSFALLAAAESLIAGIIIVVLVAVNTDESSTAGIALIYIPLAGCAIAAAAAGLSRWLDQRGPRVATRR
jgi:hypothetical protein